MFYAEMAFDGGKSQGGSLEKGVITNPFEIKAMEAASAPCSWTAEMCDKGFAPACTAAFIACNYSQTVPYQITGMNVYDMREKCEHLPLCYDFTNVGNFLNNPDVQKELGAEGEWASCNFLVNKVFMNDFMHTVL